MKKFFSVVILFVALAGAAWSMVHEGWHWCYVADPYKGVSEGYCYFDNDDNTIQVSYMGKRFWIQYVVTRKDGKVYYYGGQSSSGEIWVVSPKNQ